MKTSKTLKTMALLAAGAALAIGAAPASAQVEEEIIVTGRYGPVPADATSVSQPVSYRDLDLSTASGRAILRHRVSLTARFLCNKLGETDSAPGPSCRQAATADAMKRIGTLEEGFAPRGTAWVAPPSWEAPYPADWDTRYPG